jgi:uncharacterized protein (TIGR03435 family)
VCTEHSCSPRYWPAPPAQNGPAFEVAPVKHVEPEKPGERRGGPGTAEPERITYAGVGLHPIFGDAYGVPVYGSDWSDSERYDILTKVPVGATN